MKKNRYAKARKAGVRTIGCSVDLLEAMRQINDNVNRYSCAGKFSPRNILDQVIYLLPLIFAIAKAVALNRGCEITIDFKETGFGDAKRVIWANPALPTEYQADCWRDKGKTEASTKHTFKGNGLTMIGSKKDRPEPVHGPSDVSQAATASPKEESAKTEIAEEKPKPPQKEDPNLPLFSEEQVASRKPNGGQNS